MARNLRRTLIALGAVSALSASAAPQLPLVNSNTSLWAWSAARVAAGDPAYTPAYFSLVDAANSALRTVPLNISVTIKTFVPPDGDKRNYVSVGFYFWPCNAPQFPVPPGCNTSSGLPWVDHDGMVSPYVDDFDEPKLATVCYSVITVAQAYYFTGNTSYAVWAAQLLRGFFLDSTTGMLPNLNYAQMVPGVNNGRGIGIIDFDQYTADLVDSITIIRSGYSLSGVGGWSPADDVAMNAWLAAYTDWLITSPNGISERNTTNNHGAWYDSQLQALGLYLGNATVVTSVRDGFGTHRIAEQVAYNGSLPQEEARTRSIHYVLFDLVPLLMNSYMSLLPLAGADPVDYYHYVSPVGGSSSVLGAVDFTLPYALGQLLWPFQNVDNDTFADPGMYLVTRRTGAVLSNATYFAVAAALPGDHAKDPANLLWPNALGQL